MRLYDLLLVLCAATCWPMFDIKLLNEKITMVVDLRTAWLFQLELFFFMFAGPL